MSKYIPLSTLLTNTCTAQSCTLGIQNQNCISTIASRYLFQKQYDIALYKGHVRQLMFLYTKTTWRNTSASECTGFWLHHLCPGILYPLCQLFSFIIHEGDTSCLLQLVHRRKNWHSACYVWVWFAWYSTHFD